MLGLALHWQAIVAAIVTRHHHAGVDSLAVAEPAADLVDRRERAPLLEEIGDACLHALIAQVGVTCGVPWSSACTALAAADHPVGHQVRRDIAEMAEQRFAAPEAQRGGGLLEQRCTLQEFACPRSSRPARCWPVPAGLESAHVATGCHDIERGVGLADRHLEVVEVGIGSRRTIGQIDAEGGAKPADSGGKQHCLAGIEALTCQHIDS
ncbi:hypothetical protein BSY18_4101 (plasmid) [Blastomonas sp. RAC04]|nr:hypothetical protein BSY18_4101 [Blastomonas sp. RAC04]